MTKESFERVNHCGSCNQHKIIDEQQKKIDELQEKLKLKTQNEINASVNADCLDGCRVKLQAAEEKIKELEKDLKDSIYQFERLVIENEKLKEDNKTLLEAVEFALEYCISIGEKGRLNHTLWTALEKVKGEK